MIIRIFNSGRVADSVEQMVIGGMSGGRGGYDLTEALSLPQRLESGEAMRWRLNPAANELETHVRHIRSGWASLWVLTGSMQQRRVEVIPVSAPGPMPSGWRLVPGWTRLTRYLPTIAAVVALLAALSAGQAWASWLVAGSATIVAVRYLVASYANQASGRVRVERWLFAAIWAISLALLLRANARGGGLVPLFDTMVAYACLAAALAVAKPGAAAHVFDVAVVIFRWSRSLMWKAASPAGPSLTLRRLVASLKSGRGERRVKARKVNIVLVDDLDGTEADETVGFVLDGVGYEIDLNARNAEALRDAIQPFVAKARKVSGKKRRRAASRR